MSNSDNSINKKSVFSKAKALLDKQNLIITDSDRERPWGGFYVIHEDQAEAFIEEFFPGLNLKDFAQFDKLSPKLLMVAPQKRLSWQYHHRRSEIWRVIDGEAGVVVSETDEQTPMRILKTGDTIRLKQGERHRLVGLDDWAIIAEIWQHTDADNPSDEQDIVRLEDDFGR
ncbi:cupin domain-containing protein [Rhodohalobacter halophilus]|uniref:phosphoheptose isomerase n=1 Tax=Rhodohalobacter halophilus TaxID=1812810 RepID=UPI0009FE02CC|nr:phosphoheptose isomerase [Rhodohalobacter halophilus]